MKEDLNVEAETRNGPCGLVRCCKLPGQGPNPSHPDRQVPERMGQGHLYLDWRVEDGVSGCGARAKSDTDTLTLAYSDAFALADTYPRAEPNPHPGAEPDTTAFSVSFAIGHPGSW